MNSKAVFHYTYYENKMKYDPSIYVFIGFSNLLNSEYKSHEYNYTKLDHYIYEPCNEDSNDLKMNNLKNILDKENYLKYGLCISKFYNATSKKNISITDKSFVYPMMSKGFANEVFDLYSIYFQKCINNSDYNNNSCNTAENIKDYFGGVLSPLKFKIIDQEIDIEKFKNPIIHKLLTMRTDFSLKTWSIQNLNFKPLILNSDNGYILTRINHLKSFNYEQNDMENVEDDYGIFDAKVFWMRNTCLIYERKYKKIPDILGYLGGIFKIISMISEGINILFYKVKTIVDIENVLMNKKNLINYQKKHINTTSERKLNQFKFVKSIDSELKNIICLNNIENTNKKIFNNEEKYNNFILNNSKSNNSNLKIKSDNKIKSVNISNLIKFIYPNLKMQSLTNLLVFKYKFLFYKNIYIKYIINRYKKIISEENIIYIHYFIVYLKILFLNKKENILSNSKLIK